LDIAGVSASSLAASFGTPLLVFDTDEIRARARAAVSLFPRVMYAVKAFTSHAMIRLMLEEGLDLLAASGGELEACLRAGAPADRIVMHGSNKSDDELDLAVRAGVSSVVADGSAELARLNAVAAEQGRTQPVMLRVVPGVEVRTHEALATGGATSKFGTPVSEVVEALRAASQLPALRVEGLHVHVGSQVLEAEPYRRAMGVLLGLCVRLRDEAGIVVRTLDLGGGFGVTHCDERALSLHEVAASLISELNAGCAWHGLGVPMLTVEPGRSLVANAGVTLSQVGASKEAAGRRLVAVDGGMSDNLRPMLYGARHEVAVAGLAPDPQQRTPDQGSDEPVTIVGKHCESGDVLAHDVRLGRRVGAGDLLAFAATGAYTYSLASNYNRVGRPGVVAVAAGAPTVWLRREDQADLDRLETATAQPRREIELPPGVVIRPATARDARAFLEFWTAVVREGRYVRTEEVSHPLRVYRARFRHPWTENEAQIVASAAGRVVGHVLIQRERHPVTRHVATLGIAVAADHRSRGVGSALLKEAFGWARGVGVEKIVLSVYPTNTGAVALYRKFGFVDEGRLARHSRKSYGYEDEILMAVWLGEERDRD
jgi:diaminopimelate decarboxylase